MRTAVCRPLPLDDLLNWNCNHFPNPNQYVDVSIIWPVFKRDQMFLWLRESVNEQIASRILYTHLHEIYFKKGI